MVIDGIKKQAKKFEDCDRLAHEKWLSMKSTKKVKDSQNA